MLLKIKHKHTNLKVNIELLNDDEPTYVHILDNGKDEF